MRLSNNSARLSWIPLANALVPIVTVHACYLISVAGEYVPSCIPYFDGCTSVSSVGRHGASYVLFKLGMIPAAVLLMYFWVICRQWLLGHGAKYGPGLSSMVWVGLVSAAFLILYAVFLGTESDIYSLLRRYGATVYFSFSYLAQLLLLRQLTALRQAGKIDLPRYITAGKLALAFTLLTVGLISIPIGNFVPDKNRLQNIIEWNFALLLCSYYLITWQAWRRTGFTSGSKSQA